LKRDVLQRNGGLLAKPTNFFFQIPPGPLLNKHFVYSDSSFQGLQYWMASVDQIIEILLLGLISVHNVVLGARPALPGMEIFLNESYF